MSGSMPPLQTDGAGGPRGYVPVLDGLRAVAILLVVAAHAGLEHVVPGAFGVTLFFFISGYLITRQLLAALARTDRIGLGNFYLRRVLRLAPAGIAYVAVSGLAYVAAGGHIGALGWLAAVFYGANLYDLWIGYRSTLAGVRHPFNILWSLAIEEHFYAVWPVLLAALWRWRHVGVALLGICAAALAWRIWLFSHCTWHFSEVCGRVQAYPQWRYNRLYQGTDTRIDSIAWGALLAVMEHRRQGTRFLARLWPAGAALLLASLLPIGGEFMRQAIRTTIQGGALFLLLPWLLRERGWIGGMLSMPAALLVGRLSYSLYLWHWGAFAVADQVAGAWWLAVALPLAAGLSVSSYVLIEQPALRLRRRVGSHAV